MLHRCGFAGFLWKERTTSTQFDAVAAPSSILIVRKTEGERERERVDTGEVEIRRRRGEVEPTRELHRGKVEPRRGKTVTPVG